ncbi:protein kinase family protein [Dermacoccaceae bacterium W4C1]
MDGISRGTTLGGRYEVDRALSSRDDVQGWVAKDATLNREVTLIVFPSDHPYASAALDAARRVAGVEDRRLAQVLDVGSDEDPDVSWIVSEATHHSDSLAALLRLDTLPAEEIRRIVGEASVALETARQRGLHHQVLTPHHIVRGPDGSVQITDLAVAAALDGVDDDDGDAASRQDVSALVSIVYAGLTGAWSGEREAPGLPRAERRADDQLPAPSEKVDGVPGDLDTLCRSVLNDDEGPRTPGELARQLSPWSSDQVHGIGGRTPDQAPQRYRRTGGALGGAALSGAAGEDATDPEGLGADPHEDATVIGRRPEFDEDATGQYEALDDPYVEEDLDPPLPLLSHGTDEPDRSSSRLALSIVAAVVAVALLLGFLGLRSLLNPGGDDEPTPASGASTTASSTASGSSTPSTSTSAKPTVAVSRISSFDPFGSGGENNADVPNLIDGDPATTWSTEDYTQNFSSDGMLGVGVMLNLGSSQQVSSVTVTINGEPVQGQVLVTNRTRLRGAGELGTFSGTGTQTVTGGPLQGRYVIVFLTSLTANSAGTYKGTLAEIQVHP